MRALLLLLLPSLFLTACEPDPSADTASAVETSPLVMTDEEKADILNVLGEESAAFYSRDFENWKDKYVTEGVVWTCVEENGVVLEAYSNDALYKLVGGYISDHPTPDTVTIERENVQFIPDAHSVWVNFDEYQKADDRTRILKGVRLMKRTDAGWKIAAMHASFVKNVDSIRTAE